MKKLIAIIALLGISCSKDGPDSNNPGNTGNPPPSPFNNGDLIKRPFDMCLEYIDLNESRKCPQQLYTYDQQDKQKFARKEEAWRGFYPRIGVAGSDILCYTLAVAGANFGFYTSSDSKAFKLVKNVLATTACRDPGPDNELLYVVNEDGVITAVPVRGRAVLGLKTIPNAESCTAFTTHAGIAFGYKYKNQADHQSDLANNRTNASVSAYSAGEIKYSNDWGTPTLITSCSGHFQPNFGAFAKTLIYFNTKFPEMNLLPSSEIARLNADSEYISNIKPGNSPTKQQLTSKLSSRISVAKAEGELSKWCYSYPVPSPKDNEFRR